MATPLRCLIVVLSYGIASALFSPPSATPSSPSTCQSPAAPLATSASNFSSRIYDEGLDLDSGWQSEGEEEEKGKEEVRVAVAATWVEVRIIRTQTKTKRREAHNVSSSLPKS
ncbi:hypothetical protein PIB30_066859 [Stylosanthes scabra]|uniref:Secreted protein n=1 Tax=Stylosanthes scabra TaxID=79078 RepID=A0ABU6VPA3_9FABA|nr:hypothetical protein [Stylosanthes scabra]